MILGGLVYYISEHPELAAPDAFSSAALPAPAIKAATRGSPGRSALDQPVNQAEIDRAVREFRRVNDKLGLAGLTGYSEDCFARQGRTGSLMDFDFCVAFDNAALTYDNHIPTAYQMPQVPRFEPSELLTRHVRAGKLISSDESWIENRLTMILALTAERLAPPSQVAGLPGAGTAVGNAPASRITALRRQPAQNARVGRNSPPVRKTPPRRQQRRAADAEFMERQGYIY
jgi:hypothetical protein